MWYHTERMYCWLFAHICRVNIDAFLIPGCHTHCGLEPLLIWCRYCSIYGSNPPLPPSPACARAVKVSRVGTHQAEPSSVQFSSVQSLSHVRLFAIPWTAAHQASLSITNSWSLLKLMSIESVMPSSHLILCYPLLLLPSIFPSIRFFSNESILRIRWPKYWSLSFTISHSNEYSRLISFRIDWCDLAVQGTLKSLLQHHGSKASVLWCSACFIVQLSHPYMTTGKPTALTSQTFVGKVMSLLFHMLCWS